MSTKPLHLDPVWLRQKYETEGLSTYDIAKIVGRDPKGIYTKLVDFGIPTRPRGLNLKGEDNFMLRPGVINPFQGKKHTPETRAILSEKASVPKPYLRGEANGMTGRTGTKNPNYRDGSSPERQRLYAGSEWKAFVRQIYARDGYSCTCCGTMKKGTRGLHVHHRRTWAGNPDLRFEESNVVTLCKKCHFWVHSRKNVDRDFLA